jgi:hypothetical protein
MNHSTIFIGNASGCRGFRLINPNVGSIVKDGYVCKSMKEKPRIIGRGERI